MSSCFYKILTDKGALYVLFETVIGQFVSPAYSSLEAAALFAQVSSEEVAEEAEEHVFNLRQDAIREALRLLTKLKHGEHLNLTEAYMVNNFTNFLEATVAPHQYHYQEIDEVVTRSRKELGLNRQFAEYDNWELVNDRALFPSFQKKVMDSKISSGDRICLPLGRTSKGQRKLAGRYVSVLAKLAKILGPGKLAPKEIIEKFYLQSRTRAQGT